MVEPAISQRRLSGFGKYGVLAGGGSQSLLLIIST
jgi:hypothetical protein